MDLLISVDDETKELWTWLSKDSLLYPRLALRRGETPDERMGAGLEIAAALAVVPPLARAICAYLSVRRHTRGSDLSITVTRANGDVEKITVSRTEDAEAVARLMLGARPDSDGAPAAVEDGDAASRA